jgi:hypothetical protein
MLNLVRAVTTIEADEALASPDFLGKRRKKNRERERRRTES